jgi:hypothetical protein
LVEAADFFSSELTKEETVVNANAVSIKSNRPVWVFMLAALAALEPGIRVAGVQEG